MKSVLSNHNQESHHTCFPAWGWRTPHLTILGTSSKYDSPSFSIKEQNPPRFTQCGEDEEAQTRRYGNRNAFPTRWNREERDAETKGNAILDGNVPILWKPADPRIISELHPHISGPWISLATDRNTTPIVLKHRAANKRSETHRPLYDPSYWLCNRRHKTSCAPLLLCFSVALFVRSHPKLVYSLKSAITMASAACRGKRTWKSSVSSSILLRYLFYSHLK